ncbi:MAG: FAD-dependent oxidoreductase [Rhizobiales bacterium]|nr:FAD-dependent oxidoreductase [Hyphomicrobiales bacterium]
MTAEFRARAELATLAGRGFDVAVIGAGVNGANTAQTLAAEGYEVLLVDKGDFANGSSGRSSRLLHCGLRYLAPGASMWEFVRHPSRLVTAIRMARKAMQCRRQFVETTPERARAITFCFPFYEDGPYQAWQIDIAFSILGALGGRGVPLDYKRLGRQEAMRTPLLEHLREPDKLKGVATFSEYQFDWPERIVVDTVLDAGRLGATVRNYTPVTRLARRGDGWRLTLADAMDRAAPEIEVEARAVVNMAGIWIDEVGRSIEGAAPKRRITGTKGAHIVVRLPPECRGRGIVTLNRLAEPFYCIPWNDLHYFGPTETLYEGDIEDIYPTEEDFAFLLAEANHLLPSLELTRGDVLYGWAGVRPLTYDTALPKGARSREVHDYAGEGLGGMLAMTAGPVMTHRSAGGEVLGRLERRVRPGRGKSAVSYRVPPRRDAENSPRLLNHGPDVRLDDIRRGVREEYACTLTDVMVRRTGAAWSQTMGREGALVAAQVMGEELGWSDGRIANEAEEYIRFLEHQFRLPPSGRADRRADG